MGFFWYQCHTSIFIVYEDNILTLTSPNEFSNQKISFTEVAEVILNIVTIMLNLYHSKKGAVACMLNHADPVS